MTRTCIVIAALGLARIARADEGTLPDEGPRNAVTTAIIAPIGRGVAFGYERALVGSKLGLVSHVGARFADGGDFRTRGYALGVELRWYTLGRGAGTTLATRAMVGLFVYGRGMWTLTVIREDDASRQLVGRGHRFATQVGLGYRFMLGPVVELTPTFGFEVRADFTSGLGAVPRPTGAFGLTLGVLFDRPRASVSAPRSR